MFFQHRVWWRLPWVGHGAGRGHWGPPLCDSFSAPHSFALSGLQWGPSWAWGPRFGPCGPNSSQQHHQPRQSNQGRRKPLLKLWVSVCSVCDAVCLLYYRLRRRKSSLRLSWSLMKWTSSSIFHPKVRIRILLVCYNDPCWQVLSITVL